jgi:hypothetical protein
LSLLWWTLPSSEERRRVIKSLFCRYWPINESVGALYGPLILHVLPIEERRSH